MNTTVTKGIRRKFSVEIILAVLTGNMIFARKYGGENAVEDFIRFFLGASYPSDGRNAQAKAMEGLFLQCPFTEELTRMNTHGLESDKLLAMAKEEFGDMLEFQGDE